MIRSGLSRMKLRIIPELKFIRDTSPEHGAHIGQLLKKIAAEEGHDD